MSMTVTDPPRIASETELWDLLNNPENYPRLTAWLTATGWGSALLLNEMHGLIAVEVQIGLNFNGSGKPAASVLVDLADTYYRITGDLLNTTIAAPTYPWAGSDTSLVTIHAAWGITQIEKVLFGPHTPLWGRPE